MTADTPLTIYIREECHLCELAIRLLDQARIGWRPVDIDTDPELASRYGNYVPVLVHPDSGRELFFPFSEAQVLSLARGE